jgi:hypothetical protein
MRRAKIPDGVHWNTVGTLSIRCPNYLAWLHERIGAGEIEPFKIRFDDLGKKYMGLVIKPHKIELHHFSPERSSNDAFVVPLAAWAHKMLGDNMDRERHYIPDFYLWAISHWWKYQNAKGAAVVFDNASFVAWTLKQMHPKPE